jgi:hypothetical protein
MIDVDGREAHDALVKRLGRVPVCPRVKSGSGDPHRYHLFFKHPKITTQSKITPWHDKLEFRGAGGIVVVPPSIHKSGKAYRWVDGRSLDNLQLPEVPPLVQKALVEKHRRRQKSVIAAGVGAAGKPVTLNPSDRKQRRKIRKQLSYDTQNFLAGDYANRSNWNTRLFNAACDLSGNCVDQETATRWLLAGARPWNDQEKEKALTSIQSAYSQLRSPARPKEPEQSSNPYSGRRRSLKKPDYSTCRLHREKQ